MEEQTFHIYQPFDEGYTIEEFGVFVLPLPVELDLGNWWCLKSDDLGEILMLDRLTYGDSLLGVEREKFR